MSDTLELAFNKTFAPLFSDELTDKRYYQVFGGRGCFLANQKIIKADKKSVNISKIKKGDFVKSFNTQTKKIENKKVVNTFIYNSDDFIELKLTSGRIIRCTPDHKFLFKGKWIQIQDILKQKYGSI